MPTRNHDLTWSVSIAPPANDIALTDRRHAGTWAFALSASLVAAVCLPLLYFVYGFDLEPTDPLLVGAASTLFALKFDRFEEPRFDAASRRFLYSAMPAFVLLAHWVTDFARVHDSYPALQCMGAVFTALLGLQSGAAYLAHRLLDMLRLLTLR